MCRGQKCPLLFFIFFLFLSFFTSAEEISDFWDIAPAETIADVLLAKMNTEEKISQLFLVGYDDSTADPAIISWIKRYGLGGVKIFGRNAEEIEPLIKAIEQYQKTALTRRFGIPLFIATDQEGGWVRHIKGDTVMTPGNMAIGATELPYEAYITGLYINRELAVLGINMNFAPTVDVYINPEAHVIGPRAFSSDAALTAKLSLAFMHGSLEAGVIPVAKHFPGHGNAKGDSHNELPTIEDDIDTLWERDWLPYRLMIPDGLPAIMVGHLNFPKITENSTPTTLSPIIIKLLREKLGFSGLVLTDDLYMNGARAVGEDMPQIVVDAIKAGNNMLLLSDAPAPGDKIWNAVIKEYNKNPDFKKQVDYSVKKILLTKLAFIKKKNKTELLPNREEAARILPDKEAEEAFTQQALRSVTIIKNADIPYTSDNKEKILITGQYTRYINAGKKFFPSAETFYFSYLPFYFASSKVKTWLKNNSKYYDKIIFCLMNPNSLEVLKELEEYREKIIVISTLTPVYLEQVPWVKTAIAVYGTTDANFEAGFLTLTGKIEAEGKLPVRLYNKEK
ncbi:glycoside hydrolase family 3 protein [Spirochaetia bacterium 38H-sp]|uniref:beta-N-acetylhexosaminidase n=1 Tax=Rarispira pelagica TaxID=3141764 RepID=A0ABU9UDQ2_9SPIR